MKTKRILMSALGVVVGGISVGMFKLAAFGVDPFQSLMSGLDQWIPISFGTLYVIVNALLLLFSLIFDRHYIGLATVLNLLFVGYAADFSHALLLRIFPEASVALRCVSFVLGFVVLSFASAFYITADLGVSTYDAVALVMANKWKLWKFKYIRICTDVACVLLGIGFFLLGKGKPGEILTFAGVGTVVTAFFMGPLIDFFQRKAAIPFLERGEIKK